MSIVKAFWRDRNGSTSMEYAIIGTLISILIVGGVTAIGTKVSIKFFSPVAGNLN